MVIEPFHTWPKSPEPAAKTSPRPTQDQLDRWTAAYAVADAGSLGAPAAAAQATADAAARALDDRAVVGRGSVGEDILDLQSKLDALGFDLGAADGIYGPKTEAAVRKFQESQGITVDGIIGPETRQKLDALQDPNAAIDGGSLDPLVRSSFPPPTTNDNATTGDSFEERQRNIDAIVTASPGAAQAMRAQLNEDIEAARLRVAKIENQLQNLPSGSFSHIVRSELEAELAQLNNQLRDYDALVGDGTATGDDANGLPPGDAGVLGVSFDPENPPDDFNGKVTSPDGRSYQVNISTSESTELGPDGESLVTLEISTEHRAGTSRSVETGPVGLGASVFAGENLTYTISIPEEHYNDVLNGDAAFPDPGDLSTLPDGSSVLLRSEDFAGGDLSPSFGALSVGGSRTTSQGTAIGLEVQGEVVRVIAGPTEAISGGSSVALGHKFGVENFKVGGSVSIGGSNTLRNSELTFVDIDRNSGQAAFADFLESGDVPSSTSTGVRTGGVIREVQIDTSSSVGGSLSAGPFSADPDLIPGGSGTGSNTEIIYNNGEREILGRAYGDGVGFFANTTYDASGNQTSRQSGLLLDEVDASRGAALADAFGQNADNTSLDFQLELSQTEYDQLRERAIDSVVAGRNLSEEDAELLRGGPEALGDDFSSPSNRVLQALINNNDVNDFLIDPDIHLHGPDAVVEGFLSIQTLTDDQGALPGSAQIFENDRTS